VLPNTTLKADGFFNSFWTRRLVILYPSKGLWNSNHDLRNGPLRFFLGYFRKPRFRVLLFTSTALNQLHSNARGKWYVPRRRRKICNLGRRVSIPRGVESILLSLHIHWGWHLCKEPAGWKQHKLQWGSSSLRQSRVFYSRLMRVFCLR